MHRRILVPLDGTNASRCALPHAEAVAATLGAAVEVLEEPVGRLGPAVLERSRSTRITLVVMAGRDAPSGQDRRLGRAAATVAARCAKPLLFVPVGRGGLPGASPCEESPPSFRHVAVALDARDDMAGIVDAARETFDGLVRTFTLLSILAPTGSGTDADRNCRRSALAQAGDRLREAGAEVAEEVVESRHAAGGILRSVAWVAADVLVVGAASSPSSTPGPARLGSVTDHVLRVGSVPVFIVPASGRRSGPIRTPDR